MKLSGGSFRRMLKICGKRTFHARLSLCCGAALILVSLALAGCGDLSLNDMLENEEPGELSINPTNVVVPASGTADISGKGGFRPYSYENSTALGAIDPNTGVYTAPDSITGNYETTQIQVTDAFEIGATANITVFAPISLSPTVKSIVVGDAIDFSVSGGVPDPNYDFFVNGSLEESTPGSWSHPFSTEGTYTVEAVDSLGNSAIATITVDEHLAVVVEDNWVLKGGSITVTVVNATGAHELSTDPPVTGSFDDPQAASRT